MIFRDPSCVFVADSIGLAEVVVVFLGEKGIPAQVMNPATLGGLVGLVPFSASGVSASGIEVWVNDPAQAAPAKQLLEEHAELRARQAAAADRPATIEAVCDDCGKASIFPGSQMDSVQNCPHCGAYMDVVSDDDELDDTKDEGPAGEDGITERPPHR